MSPALIHALDHPLRRQILRALSEYEKSQSPTELAESIDASLGILSYHARTLCDLGVIRLTRKKYVRGAAKHFYVSEVAANKQVVAILGETERDDLATRGSK